MNSVFLVGRLSQEPVLETTENGHKRTVIYVAVNRGYRNSDGNYDTDFIKVVLWNGMASATKDYCHTGDMVGIKGRIQVNVFEDNNIKKRTMEIICEKVTFISPSTKNKSLDNESEEDTSKVCY